MFKRKKRILFVAEASYSSTGFGRYYYDLISRLSKSGKYDIAELGCFGMINHPRDDMIKWKYYANQPTNPDEMGMYNSNPNNKTGLYRFDKVLLDFLPDIVISMRDVAMDHWIATSPLRRYFTWIISPPVDSAPQSNDFLGIHYEADGIVPYTDYGYEVINNESPNCNLLHTNYPGLDSEIFKPLDKDRCREKLGLPQNKKIIGFVARNQVRKLFPNLFKDFRRFLDESGRDDIVLYLHTTYPDLNHWNLPKQLIETGLQNKVYMTFSCMNCRNTYAGKWFTDNNYCNRCNNKAVTKLRVNAGPDTSTMNEIYNCLDLYIQYSSSEGLAFPVIEAGMAGIPTMGVDYAALTDVIRLTKGVKLPYKHLQRDINTDAIRAIPDSDATVEALTDFFNKSDAEIEEIKKSTLEGAREAFNPDKNAEKWSKIIDDIECKDLWFSPQVNIPTIDISNESYDSIFSLTYSVLERLVPNDSILHSYSIDELLIRNGNRGMVVHGGKSEPFTYEQILEWIEKYLAQKRYLESVRVGDGIINKEDYIEYAESKEICNL